MRVLLLANNQPNQIALAHKLVRECDLAGVVSLDGWKSPANSMMRRLHTGIAVRTLGRPFLHAWRAVLDQYACEYTEWPALPITRVRDINERATFAAVDALEPELIIVSGTNLVRSNLAGAVSNRAGIVNLHTGLSPYVKGGPNCTNWCLSEGWFHLIGNSVMWLDLGIDSGNLIATERTSLTGSESLPELHRSVLEHAHDLLVRCVGHIIRGRQVPSVPQRELAEGVLFRNRDWTAIPMWRARRNFARDFGPGVRAAPHRDVELVSLRAGAKARPL